MSIFCRVMEDWDCESARQPEPNFTLCNNISYQRHPRQLLIRYIKTVYGRPTTSRVRRELDSMVITDVTFTTWKEQSFKRMVDALENPTESLLNRR